MITAHFEKGRVFFGDFNQKNDINSKTKRSGLNYFRFNVIGRILHACGLAHKVHFDLHEAGDNKGVVYLNKNSFSAWKERHVSELGLDVSAINQALSQKKIEQAIKLICDNFKTKKPLSPKEITNPKDKPKVQKSEAKPTSAAEENSDLLNACYLPENLFYKVKTWTESQLEEGKTRCWKILKDPEIQKKYGLKDPENERAIDFNTIPEPKIHTPHLEAVIRHMLLKNEIQGYKQGRVGYILYLNQETMPKTPEVLTKEQIQKGAEAMKAFQRPSFDSFPEGEKKSLNKACDTIAIALLHRGRGAAPKVVNDLGVRCHTDIKPESIDYLVESGVIHSWHMYNRNFGAAAKITGEEQAEPGQNHWRDLPLIQAEKKFKAENTITIGEKTAKTLPSYQLERLHTLVEELNKRTKHGPKQFSSPTANHELLQFMKEQGYIHNFKLTGSLYIVYVKPQDKDLE